MINLVNEFSENYELLSMICRILVTLSNVTKLQSYFLQVPQIIVLKVFNDNLLKTQRNLKYKEKEIEERLLEEINQSESLKNNNNELNQNIINNYPSKLLKENPSLKILNIINKCSK